MRFASEKSSIDHFTYRYRRGATGHERRCDRHFATAEEALQVAVEDVEQLRAEPIAILRGKLVLMEQRDIYNAWMDKYLKGEKPAV